jgi:hypothetical protein
MTVQEANALARKWEGLIADMRNAPSIASLDLLLQRARSDRQMPRQVIEHIERVTYAETRGGLSVRPSRKDQAAGDAA